MQRFRERKSSLQLYFTVGATPIFSRLYNVVFITYWRLAVGGGHGPGAEFYFPANLTILTFFYLVILLIYANGPYSIMLTLRCILHLHIFFNTKNYPNLLIKEMHTGSLQLYISYFSCDVVIF
jgi:hypothetical protein